MSNAFKSLSHSIEWTETLPNDFVGVRLPGGLVYTATGSFGYVCIQEYAAEDFTILYKAHNVKDDFVLESSCLPEGFYGELALFGQAQQRITEHESITIYENQWWLAQSLSGPSLTTLKAGETYQAISFHFKPGFIAALLPIFPVIELLTKSNLVFLLPGKLAWADPELLYMVQSILRCPYEQDWRKHFFASRVEDILFKFQVKVSENDPVKAPFTEQELRKIYEAERIISEDISRHLIIPQLSKMVLLNESRFKAVFKMVYGVGPHEYLRNKRLQRAIELFNEGLQVKEVAAATGWRPADLINAYKEQYGTTPGSHWSKK